jgi:hypothetical protein
VALLTGKELSEQIDRILQTEDENGEFTLEAAQEDLDRLTYPEILTNMHGIIEVVLSLAHRVRELEGKA